MWNIYCIINIFLLNKDSWIYKDNPTTARVDMLEYATKDAPCFDVMINNKKQSKADHLAKTVIKVMWQSMTEKSNI